jgi:hypothetical protein
VTKLRVVPIRSFSQFRLIHPAFILPNRTEDYRYVVDGKWFRDSLLREPMSPPSAYQRFKWRFGLTDHFLPRARWSRWN